MSHAASLCQSTKLVISEIAWHITQRATIAMAAHYRRATYFKSVVETLLSSMAQIHHYATVVHALNNLCAKLANAIISIIRTARAVAYLIVAVMAKSDVSDTSLSEMIHIIKIILNGKTILNAIKD
jgi:hypothetical protein